MPVNTNTVDVLDVADIADGDYLIGIDASANEIVRIPATGLKAHGDHYYVDSVNGSDANDGSSWDSAKATLDAAVGLCTASNGDVIYVAPGHAETYSTTGTKVTLDIAGITVVGLGSGTSRPTFTFSHTGATWVWSAAGVTLQNVLFVTGVDSVVTLCTISGADAKLLDIETRDTTDVEVIDTFIATGARLTVIRHLHNGYTGGDANARVWKLNGVARAIFLDCRFITKVTTAVVNFVTTACTGVLVRGCTFLVSSTTDYSKTVVDTITGSTWAVRDAFDVGAGASFSGGSGAALAGDDVSAISAALGTFANTGGTATLGALVGDLANVSLLTRLNAVLKSGGTAIGTAKSLVDAIGFDGVTNVAATAGMLRTAQGMPFAVQISVTSSAIPNNTQVSGAFTGAASGAIIIDDIVLETGATGIVAPTNVNITTDNVSGLTGASAPVVAQAVSGLGANKTISMRAEATTKHLPFTLESGKKLFISGNDAAGTGAGTVRITLLCRRVADNGSIAAGGIGS